MSLSLYITRREGPDLLPTCPTLVMSYPKLGSLGGEIISTIIDIVDEGKQRSRDSIVDIFLELFDKMLYFVKDVLLVYSPSNNIAY